MKKRIFVMFLAVLMGSQPVLPVLAESMEEVTEESISLAPERVEEENETERERTEEEKLIEKMCDTDILETAFIGKSFWNDEKNFEDIKEDLPQILLDYYESEGVDPEEMDAETLRELIDTAYESGISANTLELASVCFGDDYEIYREAILHVFEQQAMENLDEEALLLVDAEYPEMALMYKNDWYGDRTDDERIALAEQILEVLENAGEDTGGYTGNTLAQAINDLYDQEAGDCVLYLAFDLLGGGELYITVLESIISGLQSVAYR